MKSIPIKLFTIIFLSFISCKNVNEEAPESQIPAETRATIEYNQNQIDTISQKSSSEGVFRGSGGEPFWSVTIEDGTILFQTPEQKVTGAVSNIDTSGNSSTITSVFDNGSMKVIINKEVCIDGMSGKENSHKVEFQIKQNNEQNYTIYNGCGSYEEI